MIILIASVILGLVLYTLPFISKFIKEIFNKISSALERKPTKDSLFRVLKITNGKFVIQFSNNRGKTYHNYHEDGYDVRFFQDEDFAINDLKKIICKFLIKEEVVFTYDPYRLRITDGSEKEFIEEDNTL